MNIYMNQMCYLFTYKLFIFIINIIIHHEIELN